MSSGENGNTVSVIHCRPSVIFLNNDAGHGALPAPGEASEASEASEAVQSDNKRKVSKLIVYHSTTQHSL